MTDFITAQAWDRGKVERFATLPPGEAHPEGICVDREGNVYVVTVAANKPETSGGTLIVFDPERANTCGPSRSPAQLHGCLTFASIRRRASCS